MSGIIGGAGSKSGVIGATEIEYEEGSWTLACSGLTIAVQNATYTKIGNIVHISAQVNIDGTASGDFALTGLPFTNSSSSPTAGALFIRDMPANENGSVAVVIGGGTTCVLRVGMQDNNGAYLRGEVDAGSSFFMHLAYETTA